MVHSGTFGGAFVTFRDSNIFHNKLKILYSELSLSPKTPPESAPGSESFYCIVVSGIDNKYNISAIHMCRLVTSDMQTVYYQLCMSFPYML